MENMAIGDDYIVGYPRGKPSTLTLAAIHNATSRYDVLYTFIDASGMKVHFTHGVVHSQKGVKFSRSSTTPKMRSIIDHYFAHSPSTNEKIQTVSSPEFLW